MKRQAKRGGEVGANGAQYAGGQFINTVAENPKGTASTRPIFLPRGLTVEQRARTIAAIGKLELNMATVDADAVPYHAAEIRRLRAQLTA